MLNKRIGLTASWTVHQYSPHSYTFIKNSKLYPRQVILESRYTGIADTDTDTYTGMS